MQSSQNQGNLIGIELTKAERMVFQRFATYLYHNHVIESPDIASMMLLAARYLLREQQDAAAFFAKKVLEEKRKGSPEAIMNDAVDQMERLNEEFEEGGGFGKP